MNKYFQYLKLPIAKLLEHSFHPNKLKSNYDFPNYSKNIFKDSFINKYNKAKSILDISLFLETGDGPKFLGLLSAAEPENDDYWNIIKKYWYKNHFVRNTTEELIKTSNNFSGDQISGMLEAIWNRFKAVGLTEEEKVQLKSIWDSTIFEKDYYKFKHPFTTDVDRGWLLSTWGLGNEVLALLAFLAVGYKIFNDEKYKNEYDKVYKCNKTLLCCVDICIWFGKVYGAAWYDEHSQMSLYCIGYDAIHDEIFSDAATVLLKRYINNPEIRAYYLKYINKAAYIETILIQFPINVLGFYNFDKKGSADPKYVNISTYFSLRSFKFVKMSNRILLSDERTGLYLWEEKDIECIQSSNYTNATIDFIHLYSLIKDYIKNDN